MYLSYSRLTFFYSNNFFKKNGDFHCSMGEEIILLIAAKIMSQKMLVVRIRHQQFLKSCKWSQWLGIPVVGTVQLGRMLRKVENTGYLYERQGLMGRPGRRLWVSSRGKGKDTYRGQKNAGKKVLGCFVSTLNIYHVPVTMLITLHALPLVFIIAFHVILCYVLFIKWVNWDSYSLIKFFNTLHQVKRTAKFQDYGCMVMKFIFSPALQWFSTLSAQ